ncbi:hypothetical protein HAX54_035644, partial [Datura stramonium]|nr:hypothetical protein [Datura stramonium]
YGRGALKCGNTCWRIGDIIEKHLWWEPKGRTSTIWYDNWTNLGPLHTHQIDTLTCHPMRDVGEFLTKEGWNFKALPDVVLEYVVEHIR